ncbi:MAG: diguanylate cyclase [Chthoniobacterales bacterium]|nr:diguanylate cyclase [Chthoniobacterales bacterium]
MKILIAEDDAISLMILKKSVEKFGHECLMAEDGEKAWELFQNTLEVDVIISDWMMPGIDGPELCRRVRGMDTSWYTFFIFLTALGDKEHLLKGMEAGADDYLAKPLDREQLQVRLIAASRVNSLHRRLNEQKAELEKLNKELFALARRDPLTLLGNRLRLREDLEALTAQAERYGHGYCAMLCDVDFFKSYNDTYDHLAGDEVLKKVAEVISEGLRTGDSAYRYGGEEFLVILPEQSLESASVAAERLRCGVEDLALPHEAKTPLGVVTISVGLAALSPGEKRLFEELLKEADDALYGAKEAGRNRVVAHDGQSFLKAFGRWPTPRRGLLYAGPPYLHSQDRPGSA